MLTRIRTRPARGPSVADANDLTDIIATEAVSPVSSAADGQSASGRPIAELIAADKYLAAKAASKLGRRGLLFTKLLPPGPTGDCPGGTR